MKIIDYFKNKINRKKNKSQLLLDTSENRCKDLINDEYIQNILCNMPHNLSNMEKAYYIYIELGKIVKERPKFVFSDVQTKKEIYNDAIDSEYYGICKSISELYISILKDKRVGISAETFEQYPECKIGHVDTILNIDNKHYILNLIGDLSRIKTSRRVNEFCFDLSREIGDEFEDQENKKYLQRLESRYGKIDSLTREEIEQLDKKIGYSFFVPRVSGDKRGIYTEDTLELLRKDINDPEVFKKYVLKDMNIPKEEWLKYKIMYIFQNIGKFTEFSGNIGYMEFLHYYMKLFNKILLPEDFSRISTYIATFGGDVSNPVSVLNIKPMKEPDNDKKGELYYICYENNKIHIRKDLEDIKLIMGKTDKDQFEIIRVYEMINSKEDEER